jgi:cytochrome P450
MAGDPARFPLGAAVTLDRLEVDPYPVLAELQRHEPVSWLPALDSWLVTDRALVIGAVRDGESFTVDDPRFTTAAVLGPNLLSMDGPAQTARRAPFVDALRPTAIGRRLGSSVTEQAVGLVADAASAGRIDVGLDLASPLAATTITRLLGLRDVDPTEVLGWYRSIVAAVTVLTAGGTIPASADVAVAALRDAVGRTMATEPESVPALASAATGLDADEVAADVGVVLFGAIETTEGMIANLFWHLFSTPGAWPRLREDRSLIAPAIEESLRLEPAAAVVDRYTTKPTTLGSVRLAEREPVTLSLLAANRDPATFKDPDRFDPGRFDPGRASAPHLAFAQGPHACLGATLARQEAAAAVKAVLDHDVGAKPGAGSGGVRLDGAASSGPRGLVFRKPGAVILDC